VTGYSDGEGGSTGTLPSCAGDWDQLKPIVKYYKGWSESTRGITELSRLPMEARTYLDALAQASETPIAYLSTGPERHEGFAWPGSFLEGILG
jgi:adenylosuccinate synthase